MNAAIGIYDNHEKAVAAIVKLKESGYPAANLTLMGLTENETVDNAEYVSPVNPIKPAGLGIGVLAGTTLGILTGVGVFAIPGLGFLFGAGALAGAIAGFDIGIIGGGIATVLNTVGVKDEIAQKYHDALAAGKFLVVAHGSEEEVHKAEELLKELNTHSDYTKH